MSAHHHHHHDVNPESADPKNPETNSWWIWIPVMLAIVVAFGAIIFERDFIF